MRIFKEKEVTYKNKVYNVIEKRDAVAVLLSIIDSETKRIAGFHFVRQFRPAINKSILEVPAGTIEENEPPKVCAIRELKEETGIKEINEDFLHSLGAVYSSPGFSNEKIHLFVYSMYDFQYAERGMLSGDDKDEIKGMFVPLTDIYMDTVRFEDGKTMLLVNTYMANLKDEYLGID